MQVLIPVNLTKNKNFCQIKNYAELFKKFKETNNFSYMPYFMINDNKTNNHRIIKIRNIELKFIKTINYENNLLAIFEPLNYFKDDIHDIIFNTDFTCFNKTEEQYFDSESEFIVSDKVKINSTCNIKGHVLVVQATFTNNIVQVFMPTEIKNKTIFGKHLYIKDSLIQN